MSKLNIFIFLFLIFLSLSARCWDGIDIKNRSLIEIGSGNLVREGLFIDFYDCEDGILHEAEVVLIEYLPDGNARLILKDLELSSKREFIMYD